MRESNPPSLSQNLTLFLVRRSDTPDSRGQEVLPTRVHYFHGGGVLYGPIDGAVLRGERGHHQVPRLL